MTCPSLLLLSVILKVKGRSCASVARVLHLLGNNNYKVKSLMPFSISYFELLKVMSFIAFVNYEASALRLSQETSIVSIISEQPSYITQRHNHIISDRRPGGRAKTVSPAWLASPAVNICNTVNAEL